MCREPSFGKNPSLSCATVDVQLVVFALRSTKMELKSKAETCRMEDTSACFRHF